MSGCWQLPTVLSLPRGARCRLLGHPRPPQARPAALLRGHEGDCPLRGLNTAHPAPDRRTPWLGPGPPRQPAARLWGSQDSGQLGGHGHSLGGSRHPRPRRPDVLSPHDLAETPSRPPGAVRDAVTCRQSRDGANAGLALRPHKPAAVSHAPAGGPVSAAVSAPLAPEMKRAGCWCAAALFGWVFGVLGVGGRSYWLRWPPPRAAARSSLPGAGRLQVRPQNALEGLAEGPPSRRTLLGTLISVWVLAAASTPSVGRSAPALHRVFRRVPGGSAGFPSAPAEAPPVRALCFA